MRTDTTWPKGFRYMWAWHRIGGKPNHEVWSIAYLAREEFAPVDALYRMEDGRWMTWTIMQRTCLPGMRIRMEELADWFGRMTGSEEGAN